MSALSIARPQGARSLVDENLCIILQLSHGGQYTGGWDPGKPGTIDRIVLKVTSDIVNIVPESIHWPPCQAQEERTMSTHHQVQIADSVQIAVYIPEYDQKGLL